MAAQLWPDSTEERAQASLRTALWRVGQRGLKIIMASATQLGLARVVEVDVQTVGAGAKRVVQLEEPPDRDDLDRLCDAGELLPDWYDDWVLLARERFHQLRLHALESLSERCVEAGRFAEATEAGLAAVATDPLRESAHRAVIASHLAEQNTAEAVRQYRLCRTLLKGRLGIDPSPRMQELVRGLPLERPRMDTVVTAE